MFCQLVGLRLREGLAARAQEDLVERTVLAFGSLDSVKDRLRHQHHSWTSAERAVIDAAMAIAREVPKVDELYLELSSGLGYSQDALLQIGSHRLWKECEDRTQHGACAAEKPRSVGS